MEAGLIKKNHSVCGSRIDEKIILLVKAELMKNHIFIVSGTDEKIRLSAGARLIKNSFHQDQLLLWQEFFI